jgi:hypothetical protein
MMTASRMADALEQWLSLWAEEEHFGFTFNEKADDLVAFTREVLRKTEPPDKAPACKHTPEPWQAYPDGMITSYGIIVAQVEVENAEDSPGTVEADANRIVACVNACQGIDDPAAALAAAREALEWSKAAMEALQDLWRKKGYASIYADSAQTALTEARAALEVLGGNDE